MTNKADIPYYNGLFALFIPSKQHNMTGCRPLDCPGNCYSTIPAVYIYQ